MIRVYIRVCMCACAPVYVNERALVCEWIYVCDRVCVYLVTAACMCAFCARVNVYSCLHICASAWACSLVWFVCRASVSASMCLRPISYRPLFERVSLCASVCAFRKPLEGVKNYGLKYIFLLRSSHTFVSIVLNHHHGDFGGGRLKIIKKYVS